MEAPRPEETLKRIYVVGTADTKGEELAYLAERIASTGGKPLTVDSIDQLCDRVLDGAVTSSSTDYKIGLARGGIHRLLDRLAAAQRGT